MLVVVLVAPVAMLIGATTGPGEAFIESQLESVVSGEIPGSLVIDDLVVTGWSTLRARRVRFLSPTRSAVLDLYGVDFRVELWSLLRGEIRARSAQVARGTVTIREQRDGYTDLEVTFSSPGPATGKAAEIDLRNITFKHLALDVRFQGDTHAKAKELEGSLRIRNRSAKPGVIVDLARVRGVHVLPTFLGLNFRFSDVEGRIQGKAPKVMAFKGELSAATNRLGFRFALFDRPETPVVLDIYPRHTTTAFDIRTQLAEWFAPSEVDLTVH